MRASSAAVNRVSDAIELGGVAGAGLVKTDQWVVGEATGLGDER